MIDKTKAQSNHDRMDNTGDVKVYYNSACPVCDAGINRQKSRSIACKVEWKDIHANPELHRHVSDDREFVRKRLHVVDEKGDIRIGVDAFEVLWRNSPKERWKAKIISLPVINLVASAAYNVFAFLLYKWNRYRRRS